MLVEELLYGEGLTPSPEVVEAILSSVGEPIPYFVHALADAVKDETPGREPILLEAVDRAYAQRLLGDRGNNLFRLYKIKDRAYPEALRRAAAALLSEAARFPAGAEVATLRRAFTSHVPTEEASQFEPLLACLQEDYDLVLTDGRWRMRGKVLRDRWALGEPWLTEADGT